MLSGVLGWKLSIFVCGFVMLLFQVIGSIYTTMRGSTYVLIITDMGDCQITDTSPPLLPYYNYCHCYLMVQ